MTSSHFCNVIYQHSNTFPLIHKIYHNYSSIRLTIFPDFSAQKVMGVYHTRELNINRHPQSHTLSHSEQDE